MFTQERMYEWRKNEMRHVYNIVAATVEKQQCSPSERRLHSSIWISGMLLLSRSFDIFLRSRIGDICTSAAGWVADQLLPVRSARLRSHPLLRWFDGEYHSLRRQARQLERVFRRSRSLDDQAAWIGYASSAPYVEAIGRVRSAGNVTVITRNLPRNLR